MLLEMLTHLFLHLKYLASPLCKVCSSFLAEPLLTVEQFTNKVDIFTVDQASDNDLINTISKYTGSNLAAAQSSEYNITASSISTVGSISSISGGPGSSYDSSPTPTQLVWTSPSGQFTSGVSYNQNMTTTVYVQTGKTATSSFIEPCFISSSTATLSMSFTSTYSWATYSSSTASFTGPSIGTADFVNYTIPLIGTTSTGENLAANFIVKVYSCKVSNCETCNYDSRSAWSKCKNGYTLSSNNSTWDMSMTIKTVAQATTYIASASVAASACTSIASASSPQSIWSIVNQYQLMMTFQLLGWYISPDVQGYINEFQYSSFSFSFVPYYSVPGLSKVYSFFSTTQSNANLGNVGLNYGSTVANFSSLFINLFWWFLLHQLFLWIKVWFLSKVTFTSKIVTSIGSIQIVIFLFISTVSIKIKS